MPAQGYYIRVTQSKENKHGRFPIEVTLAVARRAGHCWAAGCRIFVAIIPVILWLMGPTALFVTSLLVIAFQAFADFIPVRLYPTLTPDLPASRVPRILKSSKPCGLIPVRPGLWHVLCIFVACAP